MRQIRHPLVRRDVTGIFDRVLETTRGDLAAAERRLDEIDDLLGAIADHPASGVRLDGPLGRGVRTRLMVKIAAIRESRADGPAQPDRRPIGKRSSRSRPSGTARPAS
jgi:plasmid stabilization system protein ParE